MFTTFRVLLWIFLFWQIYFVSDDNERGVGYFNRKTNIQLLFIAAVAVCFIEVI